MKKLEFQFAFGATGVSLSQKIGSHGIVMGYVVKEPSFSAAITGGFTITDKNSIAMKTVTGLAKATTHIYGKGLTNDIDMRLPIAPDDVLTATISAAAEGTGGTVIIILLLT